MSSQPKSNKRLKKPGAKKKGARGPRELSGAQIAANLEEAGFERARPLAAPYAIVQQRAKRDMQRVKKEPQRGQLTILRAENLESIPWLIHGFSTRMGGVTAEYGGSALNLGLTREDTRENFERNLQIWKDALGAGTVPLKSTRQIHSSVIHKVCGKDEQPGAGDGLITNLPGILLAVKTADCVPVIVVDPAEKAVGVFHAGWRGTVQRIVEKGVGEMRKQFGSDPERMLAAIGPGIRKCCYEVGDEVMDQFDSQFSYSRELFEDVFDSHALHVRYPLLFLNQRAPGHGESAAKPHLDLAKANLCQLRDAGVNVRNVVVMDHCTSCRTDLFFSHRREQATGRMMATVGIRQT